jgi:hypothetical protein
LSTGTLVVQGFFDAGIGRFLVSPGCGGAAALVGGLLAYLAATRKAADDRESARQERWWATLTWIYDRATAERPEARLPTRTTLDLLGRLFDQAHTDLEIQAVENLLDVFKEVDA